MKNVEIKGVVRVSIMILAVIGLSVGSSTTGWPTSAKNGKIIGELANVQFPVAARKYAGVTIHAMQEPTPVPEVLEENLHLFEKATGIKVIIEKLPWDPMIEKMTIDLAAGTGGYDVYHMEPMWLGRYNEHLLPLDEYIEDHPELRFPNFNFDDFFSGSIEMMRYPSPSDKLYGLPFEACIWYVMFYRKDLFESPGEKKAFKEKYGYELQLPKSWEGWLDVAEFFTRKKGEKLAGKALDRDFYGCSLMAKTHDSLSCEFIYRLNTMGGYLLDEEGRPGINSDAGVYALGHIIESLKYAPPGAKNATWDESMTAFLQGRAAMTLNFSGFSPTCEDPKASTVVGKVGYATPPNPRHFYAGFGLSVNADSRYPEAAWLYIQWATLAEMEKTGIAKGATTPVRYSLYEDPEVKALGYPWLDTWKEMLEMTQMTVAGRSLARPKYPEYPEMNEIMYGYLGKALAKQMTVEEALNAAAAKWTEMLVEGGHIKSR